ncbi:MAG: hypothetical protein IT370_02750 [Deltaproteobacteria bacterium]|nr:hypothetical protein [Deltaproteobacteria bacterium]
MKIVAWPIVGRSQLVQAFRPGESASKEAPFRTLRSNHWATPGLRVTTRSRGRASGQVTIFSTLNRDAATLAREGDARSASLVAKAAAKLEAGENFAKLREMLAGRSAEDVSAVIEGGVSDERWPGLLRLLRALGKETSVARGRRAIRPPGMVTGRISETHPDFVLLEAAGGVRTAVPRWLARAAHRETVGDLLALLTERLDDQRMVVNAVPALDLDGADAGSRFSPFARSDSARRLTRRDARLLSGVPAPLTIMFPVTIE